MLTKIKIITNVKQRCISVNMWYALDEEIKCVTRYKHLKKKMLNKYKSEACMAL